MRICLRKGQFLLAVWALFAFIGFAHAQSTDSGSSSSDSSTSTASPTVTTSNITSTITTISNSQPTTFTTIIQTTSTLNASSSASASASSSASASASATPIALDTRIDPGFGVLGAILIITGLPSAFWGHKNRWSSFFLIGWYSFALICLALILKFGVLQAVNPPTDAIRGVFVLACSIAGIAGGGVAIFFWQQAKYFIGAWGGFALALWIQCFHAGGLIRPIGLRWIMYIVLAVVGFCLCTLPKIHYQVLLVSTAAVGASAFVLGIDCFTTANLKEFYVWNLGFDSLFSKYVDNGIKFPISQMMEVELGLIGAFTLAGIAVQLRILKILQFKLREIAREQRRRNDELEEAAASRFHMTEKEKAEWEKEHGRSDGNFSNLPLLRDHEAQSPATEEASTVFDGKRRSRHLSGVSSFNASPGDERHQDAGALPAIDLGLDLGADLPKAFVSEGGSASPNSSKAMTPQEREALTKKEKLLEEIITIRKSIEHLRASTPGSSDLDSRSRRQSFASRRTLSVGLADAIEGPTRPPRAQEPRGRVQSMDLLSQYGDAFAAGSSISRPSSAPMQDETSWDEYVKERKLFQPPGGATAPIMRAPQPQRASLNVPNAVAEALARRREQEAAYDGREFGVGHQNETAHHRSSSYGLPGDRNSRPMSGMWNNVQQKAATTNTHARPPVTILPPKRPESGIQQAPQQQARPSAPRTRTFEELTERHRERMHDLQRPLTEAEREQAALGEARARWERSKAAEKRDAARRLAEKEAIMKQRLEEREHRAKDDKKHQHERSLSADHLTKLPGATVGSGSKRQSMLKVEDWRRYQQDAGQAGAGQSQGASRRDSNVPFPGGQNPNKRQSSGGDRRRSTLLSPV